MTKTTWKKSAEIFRAFAKAKRVTILSCNSCAEQCGTGGLRGIEELTTLLTEWDKELLSADLVEECCDEEFMRQALEANAATIGKSDTLAVISCASGVKSAYLCQPKVPLVTVLNTHGGGVFTRQDNVISNSLCKGCGECVLSQTHGICPVSACPAKSKHAPCKNAPQDTSGCIANRNRPCIWQDVARRSGLDPRPKLPRNPKER